MVFLICKYLSHAQDYNRSGVHSISTSLPPLLPLSPPVLPLSLPPELPLSELLPPELLLPESLPPELPLSELLPPELPLSEPPESLLPPKLLLSLLCAGAGVAAGTGVAVGAGVAEGLVVPGFGVDGFVIGFGVAAGF